MNPLDPDAFRKRRLSFKMAAALVTAVALGGAYAVVLLEHRRDPAPVRPARVEAPFVAAAGQDGSRDGEAGPVADPALAARSLALAAPSLAPRERHSGVDALRTALAESDDAAKIAALEAAVRDGLVSALPLLEAVELKKEPEAAPTVIRAVASIASQGSNRDREVAVSTLSRWLGDETRREERDERDAIGNVVDLVEVLGDTGGSAAVDALIDALDGHRLAPSVETLAVQKLGDLGDRRAVGAIARFDARMKNVSEGEHFDEQLRREAMEAAAVALRRLVH